MAKMNYEQAMTRLEEVVAALGNEKLGLDESLKLFEEGTKLADFCGRELDKTEQTIRTLSEPDGTEPPKKKEAENNDDLPF